MHFSSGMSARVVLLLAVVVVMTLSVMTRGTQGNSVMGLVPPAYCNPNIMDSLPPMLRRTCNDLIGIDEISSAVDDYLTEKSIKTHYIKPQEYEPMY